MRYQISILDKYKKTIKKVQLCDDFQDIDNIEHYIIKKLYDEDGVEYEECVTNPDGIISFGEFCKSVSVYGWMILDRGEPLVGYLLPRQDFCSGESMCLVKSSICRELREDGLL
jgi:hypothetical protein